MDLRQRLADYLDAKAELSRAERLLAEALLSYAATGRAGDRPIDPLVLGVDLARRRAIRASLRQTQATLALTRGQPLLEVLWSIPDDV